VNIIIFRRREVRPISLRLPAWLVGGTAVLVVAGILGNLFWVQSLRSGWTPIASNADIAWRVEMAEQRSLLDALRGQAVSETQAVGRRLASLQAQFLRLEALGQRLTEVAGLVDGEFTFGEPAALGGPELAVKSGTGANPIAFNFASQLEELASRLASREVELNVLDGLLANRKLEDQRSPRGRPVTWGWLSSPYGKRVDPITGKPGWHAGIDFAGKAGSDVVAVAGGVVTFSGERYGYGKMVEINHGDGYATRYGHQQELSVEVGEVVKKGERIGLMGSTGRSTGPHVHLELIKDGRTQDPAAFLGRSS